MKKIDELKWWNIIAFSADIATTRVAFMLGAIEANPVMAGWPYEWIAGAKGGVLLALLAIKKTSKWTLATLWYGGAATSAVVGWNLYQFGRYLEWVP